MECRHIKGTRNKNMSGRFYAGLAGSSLTYPVITNTSDVNDTTQRNVSPKQNQIGHISKQPGQSQREYKSKQPEQPPRGHTSKQPEQSQIGHTSKQPERKHTTNQTQRGYASVDHSKPVLTKEEKKAQLTIEDLSHNHVRTELSPFLDHPDITTDAIQLAMIMEFGENYIKHLQNCMFYGGGNPASDFLATLTTERPDLLVKDLRKCLRTEGLPISAIDTISKYKDSDTIDDVSPLHIDDLAYKLTTHEDPNWRYDWEFVAEQLGLAEKIPLFKMSIRRNYKSSTTMELFALIKMQRPHMKVQRLIEYIRLVNKSAAEVLTNQLDKQCS